MVREFFFTLFYRVLYMLQLINPTSRVYLPLYTHKKVYSTDYKRQLVSTGPARRLFLPFRDSRHCQVSISGSQFHLDFNDHSNISVEVQEASSNPLLHCLAQFTATCVSRFERPLSIPVSSQLGNYYCADWHVVIIILYLALTCLSLLEQYVVVK